MKVNCHNKRKLHYVILCYLSGKKKNKKQLELSFNMNVDVSKLKYGNITIVENDFDDDIEFRQIGYYKL